MTRYLPFVTAVLLFVYAGDMVWLFASNQAQEPNAVIWWAEALASGFFSCLGLAATIVAGAKLWKERNVAVLPREAHPNRMGLSFSLPSFSQAEPRYCPQDTPRCWRNTRE